MKPGGGAAIHGAAEPGATAGNPTGTGRGAARISLGSFRVGAVPVLDPFPDIAVHIVEAPVIGALLGYWLGAPAIVAAIPAQLIQIGVKLPGKGN